MARLFYQGHASFRLITDAGTVVYIDPFANRGFDFEADLVLVTHEHFDHNQVQLVPQKPGCVVLRSADMLVDGTYRTEIVKDVTVEAVPAYNTNHHANECVGYLVGVDGLLLYFAGDTSTTEFMRDELPQRHLDYAFLPCDGIFNMDRPEAEECAAMIGARHTVPIHTAPTKSPDQIEFDLKKAEQFEAKGKIVMLPGDEIEL